MRIVGGTWRGRRLEGPGDAPIRPTADRVREGLFNMLAHADWAPALDGARVLDLFAGTGALALEALSRGAKRACLIENDFRARAIIRRNIEACGAVGSTKMLSRSAARLDHMPAMVGGPFDLIFIDPPYGKDLIPPALIAARDGGWLAGGAVAITERAPGDKLPQIESFTPRGERRYGDILIGFSVYLA